MFGGEDTKEKLKKVQGGATAPLNVHLRQEIDRLNRIMKLTQDTLINLRLAIAGTVALAGPLIDALDALFGVGEFGAYAMHHGRPFRLRRRSRRRRVAIASAVGQLRQYGDLVLE